MKPPPPSPRSISVVKIGGSLVGIPQALDRVCAGVSTAARIHPLAVVPGGGPFADAVRSFDTGLGLSPDAAHWMAILAMDQYAHVLADRIPDAVLLEEPGAVVEVVGQGRAAVLAPSRWMRSADVLPHSWEVTSDSIAAVIAGALGAERLILVKATTAGDPVDSYFSRALPAGMPWLTMSWDRIQELESRLSGSSADAGSG